ncbi:MAG: hypothetical protein AB7G88_09940 [Thermomicrobiales bacterium]
MLPVRDQGKSPHRDELLGRLWDALQESGTLGSEEIEPEDVEVITGLYGADDVPPPDVETIARMWSSIDLEIAGAAHATATSEPFAAPPSSSKSRISSRSRQLVRQLSIAALTGFGVGFLVLGGGGRLAMRLAAMMSADELQGATTENLQTVGQVTLSGTFELMLTGGFFGVALGVGYAAIASLLPSSGWRRAVSSGLVFFAVCGFVTLEGGKNRDYERFGIVGLNVCLFTFLPLIFGLMIAPLFDRMDRRIPGDLPGGRLSPRRGLASLAMVFAMLPVLMGVLALLFFPPLQLFLIAPVLAVCGQWLVNRFSIGATFASNWIARVALAVPSLAGLALTFLAIERIV